MNGAIVFTEVQRISFVGYTGGEGGSPRLWNLQNLHAVPPYSIFYHSKSSLDGQSMMLPRR